MSWLERRANAFALSLFQTLEANTQSRVRILAAAGGMLVTIGLWVVHLIYPYLFNSLLQLDDRTAYLAAFVLVFSPPFAAAFSIGTLLCPQAEEPVNNESGPMSGYFYQERANKRWRIVIVAGIVAAANFLLMVITSQE
jgi:hypothetical protein